MSVFIITEMDPTPSNAMIYAASLQLQKGQKFGL